MEGRIGDVWRQGETLIFPREVDIALEAALPPFASWRAEASPTGVRVFIAEDQNRAPVRAAIETLLAARSVRWPVGVEAADQVETRPKRRRVQWVS